MSDITQITVSTERLLVPIDPDGAVIARGLHGNIIIDKINELAVEYGISTGSLNKIKVTDYNYRGSHGGSSLHLEDFRESINTINTLISRDGLTTTPISFSELARIKNFKTPDDVFIVRGLHLSVITSKLNVVIAEAGVSFIEEYQAVYDEFVVKPSSADAEAQNTFVTTLVDGEVWYELDRLFAYASHAPDRDALLNWLNPSDDDELSTLVNAPTFNLKEGYESNGTTSYMNSNYKPSLDANKFTKDYASVGCYVTSDPEGYYKAFGVDGGAETRIFPHYLGNQRCSLNSAGSTVGPIISSLGLHHIERINSGDIYGYLNKIFLDDNLGAASSNLESNEIFVLAENSPGPTAFYPGNISLFYLGAYLGETKRNIIYNAFQALMTHYETEV